MLKTAKKLRKVAGVLDLNSQIARKKLRSEIVRILYYLSTSYSGPHPWGLLARPIYPEVSPLPIKDKNAGKETREAIEELMKKGYWDQFIRILLREVKTKLDKQSKGK